MPEPLETVIRETIKNARRWGARIDVKATHLTANEAWELSTLLANCDQILTEWLKEKELPRAKYSLTESITAIRAAGGDGWDKIGDVAGFLGRDDESEVERLRALLAFAYAALKDCSRLGVHERDSEDDEILAHVDRVREMIQKELDSTKEAK